LEDTLGETLDAIGYPDVCRIPANAQTQGCVFGIPVGSSDPEPAAMYIMMLVTAAGRVLLAPSQSTVPACVGGALASAHWPDKLCAHFFKRLEKWLA
jgi:hypothetical protein